MLRNLGIVVHPTKSVFEPSIQIQYLGVIIDSEAMTITLTPDRMRCSQVIGKIVASFPAVKYGALHYWKGQN